MSHRRLLTDFSREASRFGRASRIGRPRNGPSFHLRRTIEYGGIGLEGSRHRTISALCRVGINRNRRCDSPTASGGPTKPNRKVGSIWRRVNNIVGPELSFARKVTQHMEAPIAIIKCAARRHASRRRLESRRAAGFQNVPVDAGVHPKVVT